MRDHRDELIQFLLRQLAHLQLSFSRSVDVFRLFLGLPVMAVSFTLCILLQIRMTSLATHLHDMTEHTLRSSERNGFLRTHFLAAEARDTNVGIYERDIPNHG